MAGAAGAGGSSIAAAEKASGWRGLRVAGKPPCLEWAGLYCRGAGRLACCATARCARGLPPRPPRPPRARIGAELPPGRPRVPGARRPPARRRQAPAAFGSQQAACSSARARGRQRAVRTAAAPTSRCRCGAQLRREGAAWGLALPPPLRSTRGHRSAGRRRPVRGAAACRPKQGPAAARAAPRGPRRRLRRPCSVCRRRRPPPPPPACPRSRAHHPPASPWAAKSARSAERPRGSPPASACARRPAALGSARSQVDPQRPRPRRPGRGPHCSLRRRRRRRR